MMEKMRPCDTNFSISKKRIWRKVVNDIRKKITDGDKVILNKSLKDHPWLSRHMINRWLTRQKPKKKNRLYNTDISLDTNTTDKGGRPVGSSRLTIIENQSKIEIATEKIAILYQDERIKNGGSLKRSMYKSIHDNVITSMGLGNSTIK